jgi:hypothetical protein
MSDDAPSPGEAFDVSPESPADPSPESDGLLDSPIVDGLLSTKPESHPTDPVEHYISGTKKFINGSLGAEMEHGTTALEDFLYGTVGLLSQPEGDENTDPTQAGEAASDTPEFDNEGWENRG